MRFVRAIGNPDVLFIEARLARDKAMSLHFHNVMYDFDLRPGERVRIEGEYPG